MSPFFQGVVCFLRLIWLLWRFNKDWLFQYFYRDARFRALRIFRQRVRRIRNGYLSRKRWGAGVCSRYSDAGRVERMRPP